MSHSNASLSKNHFAWYIPFNPKPSEEKISRVPQIEWKCPPKFALSTAWHVAAGEESHEAVAEKCRETTVLEAVYPDITAIPPSPFISPHTEGECSGDSQTPIIPVEEVAEEMHTSTPVDTPRASNAVQSVSENLPLSQCKPSSLPDQCVHDASLPGMLRGLESSDLQIAAAAAAFVAAVRENEGQIDTELLIKLLTDPEMVKKLIDGNVLAKPESGTPPAPEPNTSLPLPSSTAASVVQNIATGCSKPLSRAIPSTPQTVNKSLVLPCSNIETEISESASKRGGIQISTSKPEKKLIPSLRSHPDVPLVKNLTSEPGGSAHSHARQIGPGKEVPLMPCSLRPDEETIDRLIKKYGPPDIAGPFTSNPRKEAIKKMIHAYGVHDAAGVKPVAPLIASTSSMEEIDKTIAKYGMPDHELGNSFMGPSPSLLAPTPLPPTTNMHALHHDLEPSFTPIGNLHFPFSSPVTIPAPKPDLDYCKSLIKQHGEKHGTEEHPKIGQPGSYLQGLELGHNNTASIVMNPKYEKPCIYFSSSKGCRNGYNCLFQHDVSKQRAKGAAEDPVAKRMKFT